MCIIKDQHRQCHDIDHLGYPQSSVQEVQHSLRELEKRNLASRSATAKFISDLGQGYADRNHDECYELKSAQTGPDTYIVWNFDVIDPNDLDDVSSLSDVFLGKSNFHVTDWP